MTHLKRVRTSLIFAAMLFGAQCWWLIQASQPSSAVLAGKPLSWMTEDEPGMAVRDPRHPCGVICLSVAGNLLEQPVSLSKAREVLSPSPDGFVSLADLMDGCGMLEWKAKAATVDPDTVPTGCVCIAHVSGNHFVVARRVSKTTWSVYDVPAGVMQITGADLKRSWNGTGVFVSRSNSELEFLAGDK